MTDTDKDDREVRRAIRRAIKANRELMRRPIAQADPNQIIKPRAIPSPEHYHIIYHSGGASIPHLAEVFADAKSVYIRLGDVAERAAPNSEYYDDGSVGVETTLAGRTGLHWVRLEPVGCIRAGCLMNLPRAMRKRSLILLPGQDS